MNQKQDLNSTKSFVNIKRQGGWTFWGLAFTLSTLGFFSYVGMQLVPLYTVNGNIENAMIRSVEGINLKTVGRAEIIRKMNKQLYLDGSHQLLNYKEDMIIKRSRTVFTMQIDYERRFSVLGNIGVVADFSPTVECDFTSQCKLK
jgi:hypothetical protein